METNRTQPTYIYKGEQYPEYLRQGNAAAHIFPTAEKFCKGFGYDVGGLDDCHFPGANIINKLYGGDAMSIDLADHDFNGFRGADYIFSSHCLEHLENYVKALKHWKEVLRPGGQLFLYLPHPDMKYWLPQNCEKHLHQFTPDMMRGVLTDLGFEDIFNSERDLYWSFAITGVKA